MNETRQLMFGLKMSLTPGEKNKRLDWLRHEGGRVGQDGWGGLGWETVPLPPSPPLSLQEGCHGTCQ